MKLHYWTCENCGKERATKEYKEEYKTSGLCPRCDGGEWTYMGEYEDA